jgi:hypothetical protein
VTLFDPNEYFLQLTDVHYHFLFSKSQALTNGQMEEKLAPSNHKNTGGQTAGY